MSFQEQIEGKGPGDTQQSFRDNESWGEADETYDLPLSEGKAGVWIYRVNAQGIRVGFIDQRVAFIEAESDYKGKTSQGIGIGDDPDMVYENYGRPRKVFWCIGRQFLIYPALGIGFEIEKNKVRGWFLFDKPFL